MRYPAVCFTEVIGDIAHLDTRQVFRFLFAMSSTFAFYSPINLRIPPLKPLTLFNRDTPRPPFLPKRLRFGLIRPAFAP